MRIAGPELLNITVYIIVRVGDSIKFVYSFDNIKACTVFQYAMKSRVIRCGEMGFISDVSVGVSDYIISVGVNDSESQSLCV
jgi:hypothetical protein